MSGQMIQIEGPDGTFDGYLALPEGGKGPGIVVIQEIFGINKNMRDIADNLAAQGYVALCPDLFWRIEPGVNLTDQTEAEMARAFELFGLFDMETGIKDVATTISHLRKSDACTGKVGSIGYCLGGMLAYLTATRTDVDASVGYYGVNIQTLLSEASNITKPLALHIAGNDEFVPVEAQEQIISGLADNPHVELFQYPGRDHGFARSAGTHHHPEDADTANARTLAFFKKHLG
ncbi:MAG: dienelactone hydrolase family protein [Parvibaculaceae bacterium]|nr:dienelactone hydrolase family protein [Parvibaculaceae bacterium]